MFPIRDHNPSGRTPYVTWGLIALNVLLFVTNYHLFADQRALARFYMAWGAVPADITSGGSLLPLVTSMFLHGGILHIAGNMLFLWIFGDNLEDAMGPVRYLLFYLACGVAAALTQVAMDPTSTTPVVGASGAIAGVMGGYFLLYPQARIDILLILVIFIRIFTVPAWTMLGLWFAIQLLSGAADPGAAGGVAHWAHTGGFVAGFILCLPLWLRRGGAEGWKTTRGRPPHPEAAPLFRRSNVPRVPRRRGRRGPWG